MKLLSLVLLATGWGAPVPVMVDDEVCATYDARLAGDQLVVRVRRAKGTERGTFASELNALDTRTAHQ